MFEKFKKKFKVMTEQEEFDKKEDGLKEEQAHEEVMNDLGESTEPSWEDKFKEANDKYIRLYSDFDNFRKRTIKEKADIINQAGADLMKDLLTVLDDFERAVKANENATDVEAVKEGFNLVHAKFDGILKAKGLMEMQAQGELFDAEIHDAITNIPAPDESLKGKVVDVVEKGYLLKDKVLRYAKVVVGQ